MPLYSYRAVDEKGTPVEGTMDEPSAARVAAILDERGLQVSQIEPVTKRRGLVSLKQRLDWDDIQTLNDQLLAATRSHLPLVPALESMAQDVRSARLKRVLEKLRKDLEGGASLDEALDRHADEIPFTYRSLVRAGERSGNLPGVLNIAATHSRRMIETRNAVQLAFAYPIVVFAMTAGFMVLFFFFIIPLYSETYADFGSGLPAPTQFLMDLSDAARANTVTLIVLAALLVVGLPLALRFARRLDDGAFAIDWVKERLPITGKTFGLVSVSRFARSLGTLLSSGVPAIESLDLASAASGNGSLRRAVRRATEGVAAGERIADALSDTGYFTHTFCWLLSTGEQRGEVEPTLFTIAETCEREIRRRDRLIEYVTLPFLIVAIALALGFVIVALYLPIFTLGDAIM